MILKTIEIKGFKFSFLCRVPEEVGNGPRTADKVHKNFCNDLKPHPRGSTDLNPDLWPKRLNPDFLRITDGLVMARIRDSPWIRVLVVPYILLIFIKFWELHSSEEGILMEIAQNSYIPTAAVKVTSFLNLDKCTINKVLGTQDASLSNTL
uniref:Uncharacterized protein n=1 Tax=Romanomermis culicivorax TaxID=13658 RepID=A0A915I155_ROMCU